MANLRKSGYSTDETERAEFAKVIERIYNLLKTKITNKVDLEAILVRNEPIQEYLSKDYKSKPEQFTKENIVEELLDFLGYDKSSRSGESELKLYGRRWPDYKLLTSSDFYLLVEAEPLNTDLYAEGRGVSQVIDWIQNKRCTTDYGIATDGFRWVLVEFSRAREYGKRHVIKEVDLSVFFREKLGFRTLIHEKDKTKQLINFLDFFSKDRVETTLQAQEVVLENYQEQVSKKFYDKYMQLVFGDKKNQVCLVNSIMGVDDLIAKQRIAQAIVDRLIFVKFIEAKGWMSGDKAFLSHLWKTYNASPTGSFYDSYLKILFFNILNNPHDEQKKGPFAGIRYLNGGLFRKTSEEEGYPEYSVDDSIIYKLITFLEVYSFGDENLVEAIGNGNSNSKKEVMSPEILGYIFERTANHEKGAYYTPDNVTKFITSGTLQALVLDLFNSKLKKHGSPASKTIENALVDGSLDKGDLREIYSEIQNLKILDPGCGSGAFFMPVINSLMHVHKLLTAELGLPFNPYVIKKQIIENNIFGVDLNAQAVEIAKLRLWLELVSSVEKLEEVELLPNIEYNIISGNTLVGFDEYVETRVLDQFLPMDVEDVIKELDTSYPSHVSRIKELSEKPTMKNILLIKDLLVRLYKSEKDPKSAQKIKKVVERVHLILQGNMNPHFLHYLNEKLEKREQVKTVKDLEKLQPFHWILEFNEVFSRSGFDVVLGNPPYVEFREVVYPLSQFRTKECGNIYAPFFERAINLVKTGGYFSYIVPISSVCTDRMASLQELLIHSSKELKVSNFDDRPDKIFKGLEDCRSSIIFGHKDTDGHKVLSTHYHRWYAEEREKLFKHMSFVDVTSLFEPGIILKIGNEIEKAILQKIRQNKLLSNQIVGNSKHVLVYHNAPRYWIRAMNFMPEFSNEKGASISPHNKQISISEETDGLEEIIAALNSSLFYWFFILHSNCRDLTEREIKNFPFDVTSIESPLRRKLKGLCHRLMDDYKKHSRLKVTRYERTGKVTYQEFYPKKSKCILDEIDDVLAEHYGFSDEEREYIKNFDIRFRMGEQKPDKAQKLLLA
jgi:hypothetical protein